ncbi:hypothetical protein OS128_04635 [Corynebacterium sp. P5848]|uniref:hypothetical protein n=1 Tax=Corynebacterium marambiense TaxID=2765364 RepID=UPI002260FB57|nr:hypothetical protein [Corynebacterium marambiense]MCX7542202.1 hypothetical protein [Corynebacterium marambiense]
MKSLITLVLAVLVVAGVAWSVLPLLGVDDPRPATVVAAAMTALFVRHSQKR